jgi:hypothetical protein
MNTLDERTLAQGFTSDKDGYTEIGEALNDEVTSFAIVEINTRDIASAFWEFILPEEFFLCRIFVGYDSLIAISRIVVGWHIGTSYHAFFLYAK